jgi:hypothetical protein
MIGPVLEEVRLKTTRNEIKLFKQFFMFFFLIYELVFLKFDPLTASGMALCVDLGPKCQNLFCLV